jgi:phosphoglycerate dehydrogenase-like enzyme
MGKDAAMRFKMGFGLVQSVPKDRSQYIDEYFTISESDNKGLIHLLKDSDYICSVLPNTPETTGILGGGILKACAGRQCQCKTYVYSSKKIVFINNATPFV